MDLQEKWSYFLNKYNNAKKDFNYDSNCSESQSKLALIQKMLDRTIMSSNKKCDMTKLSGLDPTNFTYFIKQLFWLQEQESFQKLFIEQNTFNTWYPDYSIAEISYEMYRMIQERWQIHARMGTMLLNVEKNIKVDFTAISEKSDAYTLLIYKNGKETIASIGSQETNKVHFIELEKGIYSINFRFYCDENNLFCPEILIDNKTTIPFYKDPDKAKFKTLIKYWMDQPNNPFYLMQNLHTFYWLKFDRETMPQEVYNDFLPVINPDTKWEFGYIERGQRISLKLEQECLDKFRTYVTFVNEMSLPTYGEQIKTTSYVSPGSRQEGAFHIRFVARGATNVALIEKLRYQLELLT